MAYTPVAQRTGSTSSAPTASTGYVPVAARAQSTVPQQTFDTPSFLAPKPISFATADSTQAIPDSTTGDTLTTLKGIPQGILRDAVSTGIAVGNAINKNTVGATLDPSKMGILGTTLLGTEPIQGLPDIAAGYESSLNKTALKPVAKPIAILGSVIPTALDFLGVGGETEGASALFKALSATDDTAEGIAHTIGVLKGVGFTEDIATQYAPLIAKSKDLDYIKDAVLSAKKLQETTTGVTETEAQGAKAYTPVAERASSQALTATTDALGNIVSRAPDGTVQKVVNKSGQTTYEATAETIADRSTTVPKVDELPNQETTAGRQTKQVIKGSTDASIDGEKIVQTQKQALAKQIRDEARGAKIGATAGRADARAEILDQLRVKQEKVAGVKQVIVSYAKEHLPLNKQGELLTVVRDAATQRDLTKAFVRIDDKIQEVDLKNAVGDLKDSIGKLADSPSVSVDYRNKIKAIADQYELTGHTEATMSRLKSTQAYLDGVRAAGGEADIPQRILDQLQILSRTPKDQLTLWKVQGIKDEIELLGKLGQTKWRAKEALYEGEKDLRKQQLLETASAINTHEIPKPGIGKKPNFWWKKWQESRNFVQKNRVGLTPIEGLADITGMAPMKAALDADFGNYLTHNDVANDAWLKLTKGFTDENYERIGAIAASRQEGGLQRLANSGVTKAEIDAIQLTTQEEKAYQFVRDTFESEYPAVKKYAMDVYNADVGQVDNYVSFMSDYDAMSDLEIYDRFGVRPEEAITEQRTKTVEQGFTKERAKTAQTKLELNIDKIFRRHTDDVAYMLNMGRDIKQYFEIVNSKEMREKLGDVGTYAWLQYLDLMARKGGADSAKRIAGLDLMRKNIGAGVLAFRLSSALVQLTSFADTLGTIGAEYATRGAANVATSKEWRNFIMDNFPEVKKAMGDDIAFREFGDGYLARATQVGLKPLEVLDNIMRATAVSGAYEKLAVERGITVDLANPDKQLIQDATRLMRHSQGSSFFKDQPLALSTGYGLFGNKSVNKSILTFQSFALARWDNLQRQIWRLGIQDKRYAKAATSFFWMVLVSAAMEEGIRDVIKEGTDLVTGDTTSDQSLDQFSQNALLNIVQTVPLVGQISSALTYASNPIPVINASEDFIAGVNSVVNGKSSNTQARGGVRAVGALGSLAGVPGSSQASQFVRQAIPQASTKSSNGFPSLPPLPPLPKLPQPPKLPPLPKIQR